MTRWILAACCFLVACGTNQTTQPENRTPQSSEPSSTVTMMTPDQAPPAIVGTGRDAVRELTDTLKANLQAAMKDEGLMGAVAFCAGRARDLTADVNARFGPSVDIKRTSDRFRNPDNAPDELEQQALEWVRNQLAAGNPLPDAVVQRLTRNSDTVYRYYQPITVGTPYLSCHGDETTMKPEVLSAIRKRYPDGQATGYHKGDFRGLVRVEITEEPTALE